MKKRQDEPTDAEVLAAVLMGTATSQVMAALLPLSARIPCYQLWQLDAMATKAGKSRSAILSAVLDVGFSAVREHLDESTLEELQQLEATSSDHFADLAKSESGEIA